MVVGRRENSTDPGVSAYPDVGAARDQILAREVTSDREKASRRIDFPIENVTVDHEILLGPNSCDTIAVEKCIQVDIAHDSRILCIVADIAIVPLILMERKMVFKLQAVADLRDG
jgi:hypothetical protein